MPEVLAPGLEFLRGLAVGLSLPNERISEARRIEVWQAGAGEGVAENGADTRGAAPVRPCQPYHFKLPRIP